MSEEVIRSFTVERISDWEGGNFEFFGLWNEWAGHYSMRYQDKDPRPAGISRNVSAEVPRAANTLATTITRMQTLGDPPFELRAREGFQVDEGQIFQMENVVNEIITEVQFKRNLTKGNRGMCLFGTQVWEMPLQNFGDNPYVSVKEGTAFRPLSLLQCAYNTEVYDMDFSDHMSPILKMGSHSLRNMAYGNPEVWNIELVEKAIKEKASGGDSGYSQSAINQRRTAAKYNDLRNKQHELILYNGRVSKEVLETPEFAEMWTKFGRTDDPRLSDQTIGILDRKYVVRLHPTPYGKWSHLYSIGHYIEFELEPMGHGVGSLGGDIQKNINKILRYTNDVGKFNLFSMMLSGRGSGLKSNNMNIFPFSAIPCDDINQIKQLQPNVDGIGHGLNLLKQMIEDFRGVTHATSTLQAILTGATATESSLAQEQGLRAISITAEVNADSVIRPYYRNVITNMIDQNPYDMRMVPVNVFPKLTTDKDYRPEHSKRLLEIANLGTTIRNQMPIDFNVKPILDYLTRSAGINPRMIWSERPQVERQLDILKRLNNNGMGQQAMETNSEIASSGAADGNVSSDVGRIPNSPVGMVQ